MSSTRSVHPRLWRWFVPGGRCGASAARQKLKTAEKALKATVATTANALREVERLQSVNEILEAEKATQMFDLVELRLAHQGVKDENEHLRAESVDLMDRLKVLALSTDADTQSVLDANFGLQKDLRLADHEVLRLKAQRRILSTHLREALVAARRWSIRYHVYVLASALGRAWAWIRAKAEWITLLPFFGRRGASDVQEVLNHG